jgi:hypothetical protein
MFTLLSGLIFVSDVHAFTTVNGTLTSDVTWTKANSPYNFTGNVFVASGGTLTIEPGVIVNFNNYFLDVNGTLNARGVSSDKIVFQTNSAYSFITRQITFTRYSKGWDEQTGQGCIIEYADLKSIVIIINASPKIANNEIDTTIFISSGSPIVTNNKLNLYSNGINVMGGSPIISSNTLSGFGSAMGIFGSGNVTLSNNKISKFSTGIKIYSGNYLISENSIIECSKGIEVGVGVTATIQKNLINNNTQYGISGGSAYMDSNTITNNKIGVHNPTAGSIIHNNNILGNTLNSITATTADIDATNNWWGTTDIAAINRTIYDSNDDSVWGKVTFIPILNAPNPSAPAIPEIINAPISTPNPSTEPTAAPTIQPTPIYTPMPTRNPEARKLATDQAAPWYSLNLLVTAAAIPLIIIWLFVILGYSLKAKISKFRAKNWR